VPSNGYIFHNSLRNMESPQNLKTGDKVKLKPKPVSRLNSQDSKTGSCCNIQDILHSPLQNLKIHYSAHKSPPLVRSISWIQSSSSHLISSIYILTMLVFKCSLSFEFSYQNYVYSSLLPRFLHAWPLHPSFNHPNTWRVQITKLLHYIIFSSLP
jgi:hypothetical protein